MAFRPETTHQIHDIEETAIRMGPGGLYFGFGANGCRLAWGMESAGKEKGDERLTVLWIPGVRVCKLIVLSLGAKSVFLRSCLAITHLIRPGRPLFKVLTQHPQPLDMTKRHETIQEPSTVTLAHLSSYRFVPTKVVSNLQTYQIHSSILRVTNVRYIRQLLERLFQPGMTH